MEKTFDTGTVTINYAEGPADGMPLVMLPGATLRWQDYLPILPLLSFRYHTFALDLRGHGKSGRTPGAYRVDQFADDVEQFIRVRVAAPVALLGYSMGSHVALDLAARMPELISTLILAEPFLYFSNGQGPDEAFLQRWRSLRELVSLDLSLNEMSVRLAPLLPGRDSSGLRSRARDLSLVDPDLFTYIIDQTMDVRFHPDELLAKITCPVLLLQGNPEKGALLEDQHVEHIMSQLTDCTHVRFPEAGHNLHTPQSLYFYQTVSRFLEAL